MASRKKAPLAAEIRAIAPKGQTRFHQEGYGLKAERPHGTYHIVQSPTDDSHKLEYYDTMKGKSKVIAQGTKGELVKRTIAHDVGKGARQIGQGLYGKHSAPGRAPGPGPAKRVAPTAKAASKALEKEWDRVSESLDSMSSSPAFIGSDRTKYDKLKARDAEIRKQLGKPPRRF